MFIKNLRAATAASHKQLELNNLSLALLSDNVTVDIYCNYLIKLYPFVNGFEEIIYPLLPHHFLNLSQRKKAHFIDEDLKIYDFSGKNSTVFEESFFKETYPDIYSAAGGLYVLEGSTLGGQIIVKHLQKKLAAGFITSAYFSAYQHKTGSMWKEFLQQLTALPKSDFEEQQIIAGATKTFQIINSLLSNNSPKFATYEN